MEAAPLGFPNPAVPSRQHWATYLGIAAAGCMAAAVCAPDVGRAADTGGGRPWVLAGEPVTGKEAEEFSGAACSSNRRCLLVGDEGRRGRFFTLDESQNEPPKIVVGTTIDFVPAEGDEEADIEAAAFDRGRFYAVGSHGTSRKKKDHQPSRYSAYLVGVDGRVTASGGIARIAASVEGLRDAFCTGTHTAAGGQPCPNLQEGGANIEGLAVRDGRMYVGFRAPLHADSQNPSQGRRAFVLEISEEAVFGRGAPDARVWHLGLGIDELGRERGIRDLAAVADGFLVLAGPSLPEDEKGEKAVGGGEVFFWPGPGDAPAIHLRPVGLRREDVKPEVLLVLGEDAAAYRVIVMHDGVKEGAPTEYRVEKPRR